MTDLTHEPIDVGGFNVAPDAPAGEWRATCKKAEYSLTKSSGRPMLTLTWKLDEALTEGNESYEGKTTLYDRIVFCGQKEPGFNRWVRAFRALCAALDVPVPTLTKLNGSGDLAEFMSDITGQTCTIYTILSKNRETGDDETRVEYAPRGAYKPTAHASDDEANANGRATHQ